MEKNILAMLMTDKNSVRWQTMYNYVKSGFPQHQGNSSRNPSVAHSFTFRVLQESSCGSNFSPASSTLSPGCYGWKGWQALLSTGGCWRPSRSFQNADRSSKMRIPKPRRCLERDSRHEPPAGYLEDAVED
ncbi:hypothetical protein TNCV_1130061 [Trichonephila clavipes]|nr:hypothetical protein TNCV_1130061 [Trichonephila clavipes]